MKSKVGIFAFFLFLVMSACKGSGSDTRSAEENVTGESSPSGSQAEVKVPQLSVSQFEKMRHAGVELNVIDVRTPKEISDGKIPDAMEIDYEGSGFEEKVSALDKNRTYILYCAGGGRSNEAAKHMLQSGFKNVYNLDGGYDRWEKEVSK